MQLIVQLLACLWRELEQESVKEYSMNGGSSWQVSYLLVVRKQDPLYFPLDGTWSENILVVDGYGLCQFVWVFVTADWVMFLALEQMWQMYVAYV